MKNSIRRLMKERRRGLGADEMAAASASVCRQLAERSDIGRAAASPLAVYLACGAEINIDAYIERMLNAGVAIVAPRWNGTTYELARLVGLGEGQIRRGPLGIREPASAETVEPSAVHAWLIPGLAFTKDGIRLGYGGGWYDRLLADAPPDAIKIGVAYAFQVVDSLPSEPHDISLTGVVTG